MPMFLLYTMLFIGLSPLWTVLATSLTGQTGPVIRPDIKERLLMFWWWSPARQMRFHWVALWSPNLNFHLKPDPGLAKICIFPPHTSFWPNDESVFEIWVTVLCGEGLPSITIVLLHYRLIGESLKTTNRNYMRGLGGREAARAGRQYMYGRRMLNGI